VRDRLGPQAALTPTLAEIAFIWFHRLIAAYCLVFGVLYWIRLVGYYPGQLWRFDLMPVHWQIASVVLAALFPFAAIGLWMLASWGPVIWVLCAVLEGVMYLGLPELFGDRSMIVFSHIAIAGLYIAFRVVIARQRVDASHG
jgi:hypothetical protein